MFVCRLRKWLDAHRLGEDFDDATIAAKAGDVQGSATGMILD